LPRRAAVTLESPAPLAYIRAIPDDLYDRDALAWSERQAALLRRVARGERVNDLDWDHVVKEIEDVGLAQLNAVQSYVRQMLAPLLKLHGWPDSDACDHWRNEVATFQVDAIARYAPSMRQRIDLPRAMSLPNRQIAPMRRGDHAAAPAPPVCPATTDPLLTATVEDLESAFTSEPVRLICTSSSSTGWGRSQSNRLQQVGRGLRPSNPPGDAVPCTPGPLTSIHRVGVGGGSARTY